MTRSENIVRAMLGERVLRNGWPDYLVLPNIGVEAKYNGQGLTVEQMAVANVLVKAGWHYFVITVRKDDSVYVWDYGAQKEVTVDEFKALVAKQSAGGVM